MKARKNLFGAWSLSLALTAIGIAAALPTTAAWKLVCSDLLDEPVESGPASSGSDQCGDAGGCRTSTLDSGTLRIPGQDGYYSIVHGRATSADCSWAPDHADWWCQAGGGTNGNFRGRAEVYCNDEFAGSCLFLDHSECVFPPREGGSTWTHCARVKAEAFVYAEYPDGWAFVAHSSITVENGCD